MHFNSVPQTIIFAQNPVRYQVDLDDGPGGDPPPSPKKSIIEIAFSDIDANVDHALVIRFLGLEKTFTLKTDPADAYSLPAAAIDSTVVDWTTQFYESLQKNGDIVKNYLISLSEDGLTITLEAYQADASYDMTVISNDITGLTMSTTTGGGGSTSYDGVGMMVLDAAGLLLGQDLKPINSTGIIKIEISDYLASQFADLAEPRFVLQGSGNFIFSYNDLVIKYRVAVGYHVPGLVYISLYDNYHWAIAGGLSREAMVYWNTVGGGFWNHADNKKRFHSWAPMVKKTSRTNHQSLYFFSQYADVTEYHLMIQPYLSVESTDVIDLSHIHSSLQYIVLEFMVGYTQVDFESLCPAQSVVKYDIWLEDQNGRVLTEVRTYVLDDTYHEYSREFVFKNSFGVFDYYRFTGIGEKNLEYDRDAISLDAIEVETPYNAPDRQIKILELQAFKLSSGWVDLPSLDYLREFLLSPEIYEILDEVPYRCLVSSKKTSKYKVDGEYLYSLEFEYERAYRDNFYSTI